MRCLGKAFASSTDPDGAPIEAFEGIADVCQIEPFDRQFAGRIFQPKSLEIIGFFEGGYGSIVSGVGPIYESLE